MLRARGQRKKTIGVKDIEAIVAKMARIPPKTVSKDDAEVLRNLDRDLKRVVFGQDKAIDALASAIKLARAGLRDAGEADRLLPVRRPDRRRQDRGGAAARRACSGVELLRFDMSEYMERHTVSRLIGAPPGYVGFDQGGLLTDGVDQHPHCVLLLDEIEKAHPDLFNILLQVMDHGKLTDHNGKTVDFRNVILIMTTNAGAADMAKPAHGLRPRARARARTTEAINRLFTPEFRNRLDAVDHVRDLPPESHRTRWSTSSCCQLEAQLADRKVIIELSDEARDWLAEKGYDQLFGARPLARVIQEHIKKPLAEEVLFGKLKNGGAVRVVVKKDEIGLESLGFEYPEGPAKPKPEKDVRNAAKKKKRTRSDSKPRRPAKPKGGGDKGGGGGVRTVPKVPLVRA